MFLEATRKAKAAHSKPTATRQLWYLMQQRCNRERRANDSDNGSRRPQLAAQSPHSPNSLLPSLGPDAEGRRHLLQEQRSTSTGAGHLLQVYRRNEKRPPGGYFKCQGAVQGSIEMAIGQGNPPKPSKGPSFYRLLRKNKRAL